MAANPAIYLDHAATTPIDEDVLRSMQPYLEDSFANPSARYSAARITRRATDEARSAIAKALGAKPTEIIFTSGGTEGDNLAVQGVLRSFPGAHWVTTAIEHDAVLTITSAMDRAGYTSTVVDVKPNGIVDPSSVSMAIRDETVLLSVMLANNEIGTIQPLSHIFRAVQAIRADRVQRGVTTPLYLHTDACQATSYLDLHVDRLGVDLLTLNGAKVYGPKGTGALYVRHGTRLEPLFYGGGQERGRRSGTENIAGAVGLARAVQIAVSRRNDDSRTQSTLREKLIDQLLATIPGAKLNGDPVRRLPGNINMTIPGAEGEAMVLYLDNVGVLAATGSACSSGDLDPSHVLLALGRSRAEAASSLRLTLGRDTTRADIERVATVLPPIVERLRSL